MAKTIYNKNGSVTYRGKTFRTDDVVTVYRDELASGFVGRDVTILNLDTDGTARVVCDDADDKWGAWVTLEDLFETAEEEAAQQPKTPERNPWDMPELKPWMRVVNHNDTYVIAEVDGVLTGLRIEGCESLEFLQSSATAVYDAPRYTDGDVAHHLCLSPETRGDLLWSETVADKQRKDYETKEVRRKELQAEIDKLTAELAAIS